MHKTIDAHIKQRFHEYMTESFPGFLKVKTGFDGLDVYQRKLGKLNSSWIAFGGEKNDTNIFCAVFWTTSGKKIKELEPWVKRLAGDIPKDGFLHLQSAELIGDDITGKRSLEIKQPPSDLGDRAFFEYQKKDIYKKALEIGINQFKKSSPDKPLDDFVKKNESATRLFFSLWSRVADNIEIDLATLDEVGGEVMARIFYRLEQYGVPFLEARMSECSGLISVDTSMGG